MYVCMYLIISTNDRSSITCHRLIRKRIKVSISLSLSLSLSIYIYIKMSEERKEVDQQHRSPPQYGTFQGVANYQPQPVTGFPQPVPPPGLHYSSHGYHSVPGYVVAEGRPVPLHRLPCCGLGFGWFLFIVGFFLGTLPWYIGTIILMCVRTVDYREKPGYIACTIAAVLATIAIMFGVSSQADW